MVWAHAEEDWGLDGVSFNHSEFCLISDNLLSIGRNKKMSVDFGSKGWSWAQPAEPISQPDETPTGPTVIVSGYVPIYSNIPHTLNFLQRRRRSYK